MQIPFKMKHSSIVLFIVAISFASLPAKACDVCGCSLGGNYFGILPQFNKNFVGLRWSQSKFYAHINHNSQYLDEEYSNDTYMKAEVWGRFYINKRFQVFAFVPYAYNKMEGTEQNITSHGLSDITLLGNYLIFNTGENNTTKFKHTLMGGVGIKLPTGKNNLKESGVLVNPNFQMGTGSTDFLISSVYTLRYQKVGLNTEAGCKLNTRNAENYLFGNQFHASTQFFFWQNVKSFSFLPNTGLYYEQAIMHKDDEIIQINTGGEALLLAVGLETYFKNFTIGVNYKRPILQNYNSDALAEIQSKDRWMISLTCNF